jgi:hypothetical protein
MTPPPHVSVYDPACPTAKSFRPSPERFIFTRVPPSDGDIGCAMYPWPFGEFDAVMDDALDIAMDYLIRTGQAVKFRETQTVAANAIACSWRAGVRNRIRLSNLAVRAVEQQASSR